MNSSDPMLLRLPPRKHRPIFSFAGAIFPLSVTPEGVISPSVGWTQSRPEPEPYHHRAFNCCCQEIRFSAPKGRDNTAQADGLGGGRQPAPRALKRRNKAISPFQGLGLFACSVPRPASLGYVIPPVPG